jgi:RNA polymerase sigma factor (sigma-70 family)
LGGDGDIKELLPSYIKSLNLVIDGEQRARARGKEGQFDLSQLRNMETDLRFVMNWLKNGYIPEPTRSIERRSQEQRTVYLAEVQLEEAARRAALMAARPADLESLTPTLRCKVEKAMLRLSTRERQAFMLRYVSGYSPAEIAEIMQVTESTVRVMNHKARKKFIFLAQ